MSDAQGSRYDGQIAVFGGGHAAGGWRRCACSWWARARSAASSSRNLAEMGVATGAAGELVVTDDDVIEKSNLSRQFLFRDWNIGRRAPACMCADVIEKSSLSRQFLFHD